MVACGSLTRSMEWLNRYLVVSVMVASDLLSDLVSLASARLICLGNLPRLNKLKLCKIGR